MHSKAMLLFLVLLLWSLQGHFGLSLPRPMDKVFSTQDDGDTMLQNYSRRAKLIFFFARVRAGNDGSPQVEVKHLLTAIVLEDQGRQDMAITLERTPGASAIKGTEPLRKSFLQPDVASWLLARLDAMASHAEPVATSQDLPVSIELEQVLTAAESGSRDRQAQKVEPLYLLSAALADRSSKGAQLFLEAGITHQMVLDAIKGK